MNFVFLIACCPTLNVLLENNVKDKHGKYDGIYIFQGFSDGMDYWVDAEGNNAIWYQTFGSSGLYDRWRIGSLPNLGSATASIWTKTNILEMKCPNNEGYVLSWKYWDDSTWIDTNDVYIKCANENDFCTSESLCATDQGDCDTHDECQDELFCGSNNCPDFLGFHYEFDCCYAATVGDENFCASGIPCGEDEGDCDSHEECQGNLICGSLNCPTSLGFDPDIDCCYDNSQSVVGDENFCTTANPCGKDEGDCDIHDECQDILKCVSNNCPQSLGFNSEIDCCFQISGCGYPYYWGDDYCDDENNNVPCAWDGGDCCGDNVNTDYCSSCQCLYPNAASSKKSQSFNKSINNRRKTSFEYKNKKPTEYSKLKPKLLQMSISRKLQFEYEIPSEILFHSMLQTHNRRRQSHRKLMASKTTLQKTSSPKSSSPTELKKSHHASADFGLTVVLNPKEPEYSNALKNSFTGFKTLVHTPYDFAEVDAVGMAIDENIRAYIGIRGYHSWTTEAANAMDLKHKRCLARTDDLTKYHDIRVDIFANYTKKGCILECYANLYYDMCRCIPYHYPDFTKAWHVNSTTCDYNGLKCLSTVQGKFL